MLATAVHKAAYFIQREDFFIRQGATYMRDFDLSINLQEQFREDIIELFILGEDESTHKMNSVMILDKLRQTYPGKYTLPGENKIRAEISRLQAVMKNKGTISTADLHTTGKCGCKGLDPIAQEAIAELFESDFQCFLTLLSNKDAFLNHAHLKPSKLFLVMQTRLSSNNVSDLTIQVRTITSKLRSKKKIEKMYNLNPINLQY